MKRNRLFKRSLKIGKVFGRQGELIHDYRNPLPLVRIARSPSFDEIDEETLQRSSLSTKRAHNRPEH